MTSTVQRTRKGSVVNISAQDLIKNPTSVNKHGLLRKKGQTINLGKWPHRFVILAHDSLYIYANETSRAPNSKLSLVGYNRVCRAVAKSHEWCFSIMPASNMIHLKPKLFACVSDTERKAWMLAIKSQLYVANKIQKPEPELIDKLRSISIGLELDENDFSGIEETVFLTAGDKLSNDAIKDNDDSSSYDSSVENSPKVIKKTRSYSLPQVHYTDARSTAPNEGCTSESHDDPFAESSTKSNQARMRKLVRAPSDPSPKPPPRYSEVVREDKINENDYANLKMLQSIAAGDDDDDDDYCRPQIPEQVSLESQCTVNDAGPDRDDLIIKLQAKKKYGTYLIRKSRSDTTKMIAYLTQNGHVKEFNMYWSGNSFHLEQSRRFQSIEELLQHYTHVEPLPNTKHFLKQGFHSVP